MLFWAVYSILWCARRWYIQAWSWLSSATGIQMIIFIELVQYAKNLGGKSRKNLVKHQIIKMIRKFNSIICRFFFTPHSQDNAFSLLHGPHTVILFPNLALQILKFLKNAEKQTICNKRFWHEYKIIWMIICDWLLVAYVLNNVRAKFCFVCLVWFFTSHQQSFS